VIALLLAAALWTPPEVAALQRAVDAALDAPTLRGAHVGVLAVDADSGAKLYERNAGDEFTPASTFKLLAGSAAMTLLGPQFSFVTDVEASGGDLVLRGGGDPLLAASDLEAAANAVAASSSKHYDRLVGDAARYAAPRYPAGWSVDDLPYGYAAIPSALCLEENVVHAIVAPAAVAGAPAQLATHPQTSAFSIENDVVTGPRGSDDTTDIERPWDRPTLIRLTGSFPLGPQPSDDFEPAVPDPPAYALDVFRSALQRHGVDIAATAQGSAPAGATVLWRHASAPLARLLALFWQPSDNLLGEQLLLELGAERGAGGTDTRSGGAGVERAWLRSIGADPASVTIADGSGLSEYDRITPAILIAVLEADWKSPQRAAFLDALPLAGVRGTLASSFTGTPLASNVYAKTGSINHTRTLAGYLVTPRHGTVAFALLINDWMDASPQAAAAITRARAAVLRAMQR